MMKVPHNKRVKNNSIFLLRPNSNILITLCILTFCFTPSVSGADVCSSCEADFYCSGEIKTACPSNSYSPTMSTLSTQCECGVGFQGPNGGTCTQCAVGKYCPGGSTVSTCPGFSSSPAGSDARADCTCNAGYWGTPGDTGEACT